MDSDGFTINWTAVSSGQVVIYMALGGSDLTNAAIKNFTSPASTGNQAHTGVGFQGDCALFLGGLQTAGELGNNSGTTHFGMGFATSSSNRAALGAYSQDSAATSDANALLVSTKCFTILNGSSVFEQADFVSFDSDGFTINWDTVHSSARNCWALVLKGGQYAVGTETQGTSTGTKATTGVGFQPTGLLVTGINKTSSASVQADWRHSIGVASGATARACAWSGDQDNVGTTVCDRDLDTASILKHLTEGTPTLDAEADLDSFDSDGFTLDWVTADATARQFAYLAFGSAAGGGSTVEESITLTANPALVAAANATFEASIGLAVTADVTHGADATAEAAMSLAANPALTTTAQAIVEAALSLAADPSLETAGGVSIEEAISLSANPGLSFVGSPTIEETIGLAIVSAVSAQVAAVANAAAQMDFEPAIAVSAVATYEAALALAVTSALSTAGALGNVDFVDLIRFVGERLKKPSFGSESLGAPTFASERLKTPGMEDESLTT